MWVKATRLFFRLLSLELLRREAIKLFGKNLSSLQECARQRSTWILYRILLAMLYVGLLFLTCIFGTIALALYLNEVLSSTYQGFLYVALVCAGLLVFLMLLRGILSRDQ